METIDVINYQDEYMSMDYADILSEMLEKYKDDEYELTQLLCECETLLQTNDIYLKKLNERGCKRLLNLIIGIENKCKRRLRDNFQIIHKITLEIEKKILSRFKDLTHLIDRLNEKHEKDNIFTQQCISFLLQKLNDHQKILKDVGERMDINEWAQYRLDEYKIYSDTRKILQITSDIYLITKGKCEIESYKINKVIKELELSEVEISPYKFAKEIMQKAEWLPLYKDELIYNDTQIEISKYGTLICRVYNLIIDQNINELSVARNEGLDTLCLPLIEKSIKDNNIIPKPALDICQELLRDMQIIYEEERSRERKMEEKRKKIEDKQKQDEEKQKQDEENKRKQYEEKQKRYSLSLVSPVNLIKCSLDNYVEDSFEPTPAFGIEKGNMKYVKGQISSFSPNIIVMPEGISKEDLNIKSNNIHIVSLADFYFCLWNKNRGQDKNAKYIALIDYYEHKLYVSCYCFDNTGIIKKEDSFSIPYNKTKKSIMNAIKKQEFLADIPEKKILLYRIFESEKYINVKLEKMQISFIGNLLSERDSLRTPERRIEVIDSLYEFEDKFLTGRE